MKVGRKINWWAVLTILTLVSLLWWFSTSRMFRFYINILFGLYALTESVWVSVVLLGVFQTVLMIPFRVVRLRLSTNIKEFQTRVEAERKEKGVKKIKEGLRSGQREVMFYVIDFLVQLTTFLTIGRMFLKDFYNVKLDPGLLYSFVPYPEYPLQSVMFKIPYVGPTETVNLGWKVLLLVWVVILLMHSLIGMVFRFLERKMKMEKKGGMWGVVRLLATDFLVLYMAVGFLLVRWFPKSLDLKVFSGDVTVPNRTFNTITAVVTFVTLLWFGLSRIMRKTRMAKEAGISEDKLRKGAQKMFNQSLLDSSLVGLGAYLITNHIPSAFELSVFTLELISLTSPLTLDRIILKSQEKSVSVQSEVKEDD